MKKPIVFLLLLLVARAVFAADAFAVVGEIDRLAAKELWPGFAPRALPIAIYDGARTLLFRHPSPPASFRPLEGHDGVFAMDGRFEAVTANSSAKIGGIETATVMAGQGSETVTARAGLVIHELFHVYQRTKHPSWSGNEAELFVYPMTDAVLVTQQRLEVEALRRALARSGQSSRYWARVAMAARQERFAAMSEGAVAYERGTELNEGLATYVQHRAVGTVDAKVVRATVFAPDAVRDRAYTTGHALGRLLDRFAPEWRTGLERDDTATLDGLLRAALAEAPAGCGFTQAERSAIAAQAGTDVAAVAGRRTAARDAFLSAEGWTLIIESGLLFPSGFDPLNVQLVAPGQILHTRFVELSNGEAKVRVLDRPSLTDAAGAHPMFNGVKRLTVTGIVQEPEIVETDGTVTVKAEGVEAKLPNANVTREGHTIRISKL
jgi:hypothetical protein